MAKVGYVDGFVLVVPKNKIKEYKKMAQGASRLWKKYGAIDYVECIGDDLKPNTMGYKIFYFPQMTKLKRNETAWFSFVTYKSKKHRDQVNSRVMKDSSMQPKDKNPMDKMPFDMRRMAYGGFRVVVRA